MLIWVEIATYSINKKFLTYLGFYIKLFNFTKNGLLLIKQRKKNYYWKSKSCSRGP
jgi:hypothetical protein